MSKREEQKGTEKLGIEALSPTLYQRLSLQSLDAILTAQSQVRKRRVQVSSAMRWDFEWLCMPGMYALYLRVRRSFIII